MYATIPICLFSYLFFYKFDDQYDFGDWKIYLEDSFHYFGRILVQKYLYVRYKLDGKSYS